MWTELELSEPEDVVFGKEPGMHATSLQVLSNGTPSKSQQKQKQQQQLKQQQGQAAKPKFQYQTLVFSLEIHCNSCLQKVKKAVFQVDGVETISWDAKLKRVTVTGHFDQQKMLKKVAKTGKQIAIVNPKNNTGNNTSNGASGSSNNPKPSNTTENTLKIAYALNTDTLSTAFSDDNVNSCSVM